MASEVMFKAVTLADVAGHFGFSPEMITAIVAGLAPHLVSPLTTVLKRWRCTKGADTRMVVKLLTACIIGIGGFVAGLYGYDVRGVVNAVVAAVAAYFTTTGSYDRDVQAREKAERKARESAGMPPTKVVPEQSATALDLAKALE